MGRPKGSGRDWGMPEDQWQDQKKRNMQASREGRALYVRGIPPEWSGEKLQDFFSGYGKVEGVNLLPARPKQPARAAFVNFDSGEEANHAAEICDNMEVEDATGAPFKLVCSMKQGVGKKVDYVSGFTDMSKARQEKRSLYISNLPPVYEEEQVRDLVEVHGLVEEVKILPQANKKGVSCFVTLTSPGEAATAIEGLDNQEIEGYIISCGYPRPPKRTREVEEEEWAQGGYKKQRDWWQPQPLTAGPQWDWWQSQPPPPHQQWDNWHQPQQPAAALPWDWRQPPPPAAPPREPQRRPALPMVEIRGFPMETSSEDISAAIEAGGRSVLSVRLESEGPPEEGICVAKVRLKTLDDATAVKAELHDFELTPGCFLQVTIPETREVPPVPVPPPPPPEPPAKPAPATFVVPPPPPVRRSCAGGAGGPRRRGRVVGRLAYDRSAYRAATANPFVSEDLLSRGPKPPSYPPPQREGVRPSQAPHLDQQATEELEEEGQAVEEEEEQWAEEELAQVEGQEEVCEQDLL